MEKTTLIKKITLNHYYSRQHLHYYRLFFLASFLLESTTQGIITIAIITAAYSLVALVFTLILNWFYKRRDKFFFYKSIISQKKADGLFGIISFTSLFVALTALSTLALLQISRTLFN